ncbi:hypothetical protein Csa_009175 [Cucumis sativus]|uniref:Secreted protein n=1 Tax=Cucumis sativus TaxID=3659 RepID=A0A0A0KWE1_CUCSA|nr:hypothetical protein Csa_009175 [Cucumis sativus]
MAGACSPTVLIACWPWWLLNRCDNAHINDGAFQWGVAVGHYNSPIREYTPLHANCPLGRKRKGNIPPVPQLDRIPVHVIPRDIFSSSI